MNAIDWSKGPTDATHARVNTVGVDFYRRIDGLWMFFSRANQWECAWRTSEADCVARPKATVPEDNRLHLIRNACSEIHQAVEHYNVSIDCSAAMRAVIEAMIDAGYRKQ